MKNKIELAEPELRAQFLEQEKKAEMQLKEAEKQLEMTTVQVGERVSCCKSNR